MQRIIEELKNRLAAVSKSHEISQTYYPNETPRISSIKDDLTDAIRVLEAELEARKAAAT